MYSYEARGGGGSGEEGIFHSAVLLFARLWFPSTCAIITINYHRAALGAAAAAAAHFFLFFHLFMVILKMF